MGEEVEEVGLSPWKAGSCSLSPAESWRREGTSRPVSPFLPLATNHSPVGWGRNHVQMWVLGSWRLGRPTEYCILWPRRPVNSFLQC